MSSTDSVGGSSQKISMTPGVVKHPLTTGTHCHHCHDADWTTIGINITTCISKCISKCLCYLKPLSWSACTLAYIQLKTIVKTTLQIICLTLTLISKCLLESTPILNYWLGSPIRTYLCFNLHLSQNVCVMINTHLEMFVLELTTILKCLCKN